MKRAALGALAGAVVTIAVYEGSALVTAGHGSEVEEGETHTAGGAPAGPVPMVRKIRLPGPRSGAAPTEAVEVTDLDSALARIVALEEENARLQFESAIARGQVRTHEGTPRAWPDDLPEGFQPEVFEGWVHDQAAQVTDAEVAAIDCEEYPCIAVLQSHSDDPDWHRDLSVVHDLAGDHPFGEEVGVMGMVMVEDSEEGQLKTYAFALTPGEESAEDRQRTEFRARSAFDDIAAAPGSDPP